MEICEVLVFVPLRKNKLCILRYAQSKKWNSDIYWSDYFNLNLLQEQAWSMKVQKRMMDFFYFCVF